MKKFSIKKYHNPRVITINCVSLLSFGMMGFTLWMIFKDYTAFVSEFSSKFSAVFWTVLMVAAGIILPVVMIWMSGKYVLSMQQINRETIEIELWTLYGSRKKIQQPITILNNSEFKSGVLHSFSGPSVNAPWYKLKTTGGRTLVLDAQGIFYDEV